MIEPRYFVMGIAIVAGLILGLVVFVYLLLKYPNATLTVMIIATVLFVGWYVGRALQEAAL